MLSRRVASRQSCRSSSPSKSPNVRFVFPRSIASNTPSVYPRKIARLRFLQCDVATADRNPAEETRKLRPFWREGRITQWPARESRRRLVLAEVVRAFPLGKRMAGAGGGAVRRQ